MLNAVFLLPEVKKYLTAFQEQIIFDYLSL